MKQENKSQLPAFLKSYFWDVKFEDLDIQTNTFFIIKRLLDRGNSHEIRWLVDTYGKDAIKKVVLQTKDLARPTGNFWADIFDLNKNDLPCLQTPYQPRYRSKDQITAVDLQIR